MNFRFIKSTIRKRIFIYFFLTSIFSVTALGLFSFIFYYRTIISNETQHLQSTTNKAKYNMELLLSIVDNTSILLSSNEDIQRYCSIEYDENDPEIFNSVNFVNTMLRNTVSLNEHLQGIYIMGKNSMFFSSYWDVTPEKIRSWFSAADLEKKDEVKGIYRPQFERSVISYIKPIFRFPEKEPLGVIIIDINYIYLNEIFTYSSLTDNSLEKILIVNSENETLFTYPFNTDIDFVKTDYPSLFNDGIQDLYAKIFNKESYIVSEPFENSDWRIIRITFLDNLIKTTNTIMLILIASLCLMLLIYLIISLILSKSISKPITELNEKLRIVQDGNFDVKIVSNRNDEIGDLIKTFNIMTVRIDNLLQQSVSEQKRKSDLEFEILQAQINPHFLYNTLDSIKWLAVIQGIENIGDMITALINLLKYNISNNSLVSVAQEIESVKNYTRIQKYRYGDLFSITYDIPDECSNLQILKFLLQPIVENSIVHGLKELDSDGQIIIKAGVESDEYLIFEIIDNGSGFQFDEDGKILSDTGKGKGLHSGIGIHNLEERIHLFWSGEYGISFSNDEKGGGKVTIRLPIILPETAESKI